MKKTLRTLCALGTILFPLKVNGEIKGNISSNISSSFIPPMVGVVLGTGPHLQNSLNLDIGKFSLYTWANTDLGGNLGEGQEANEFDLGISYNTNIKKTKNSALSLRTGFERWKYTGDYDNVFFAGLDYNGLIDASFTAYQAIGHDETPSGRSFLAKVSKTLPITRALSVTPRISSAYMNNFYGNEGLAHITIGTGLNYQTGPVNISASLDQQLGIMKKNPKICDKTSVSLGIGVDFKEPQKRK